MDGLVHKYEYYYFGTHEYEHSTSTRNSVLEYWEYEYQVPVPQPWCRQSNVTIIGSDGLLPGPHQAIIWTNAGILLTWPLGTNFSEIIIKIHTFSFKKIHLNVSSAKWRPFCLGLSVLTKSIERNTVFPSMISFLLCSCP